MKNEGGEQSIISTFRISSWSTLQASITSLDEPIFLILISITYGKTVMTGSPSILSMRTTLETYVLVLNHVPKLNSFYIKSLLASSYVNFSSFDLVLLKQSGYRTIPVIQTAL